MKRTWIAGLAIIGAVVTGCSDDGDSDSDTESRDPGNSAAGDEDGSDGGSEGGELPKFCDLLTADQVSEAVGATVTVAAGPFDACEFSQEDPRAVSGSVGAVEVDTGNGGFDAYKSGSTSVLTDAAEQVIEGLGDDAFVTTGAFGESENLTAAGGVLVGGTVYTVNLAQSVGLSADELVAIAQQLLELMVEVA
jgi:hypothetical protein